MSKLNELTAYMKKNKNKVIAWSLLFSWMLLIFIFSAQNADESGNMSGSIVQFILNLVYPGFKQMTPQVQFDLIEMYQGVIRKSAHFTIYGMLGLFSLNAYSKMNMKSKAGTIIYSFSTCVAYAITDEIHQSFVPGRSCEFTDVFIDSAGALLFIFIAVLISRSIRKRKSNKEIVQ